MYYILSLISIFLIDVLFRISKQYGGYMGLGVPSIRKEDQVVPHMPEEERDYDLMMPLPLPQCHLMINHLKMKNSAL